MKALTKPEKFRATSHIYGYECEDDPYWEGPCPPPPSGTEWVVVDRVVEWDENGDPYFVDVYDCVDVDDPDINDC